MDCRVERMVILDGDGAWHTVHLPWATNSSAEIPVSVLKKHAKPAWSFTGYTSGQQLTGEQKTIKLPASFPNDAGTSVSRTDKPSHSESESKEDESGGSWELVEENDVEDWVWVSEHESIFAKVAKSLRGRVQEVLQKA